MSDATHPILSQAEAGTIPVHPLAEGEVQGFLARKRGPVRTFAAANKFTGKLGQVLAVPGASGAVEQVLLGLGGGRVDPSLLRALAGKLPAGDYALSKLPKGLDAEQAALAFALGTYRFDRYKKHGEPIARLVAPKGVDAAAVTAMAHACALARDMVNTPANDMGPLQIETIAGEIAQKYGATLSVVRGDDLLKENYSAVHAVGRAAVASRAPRMIEVTWGDPSHPVLALVGKGVVFDTGGLDIKPSAGMRLMKKDMGGAANVLALAQMVMDAKLKLHLRVLIPAVENAVAGNAFRPMDVFPSRKGLTVEIGNTDAEGRLVLADALALADEDKPDLLIDMGTLTGAARVALGPDLPPFYTQDEALAADVARCAASENDPLWRMPLWAPYDSWLDSKVATINNAPSGGFAGSITCALFLQRFVEHAKSWLHLDIFAWTPSSKPGRPEGGECQAARALYKLLSERYG